MRTSSLLTVSLAASAASAYTPFRGFTFNSTRPDGTPLLQKDYEEQFNASQYLPGTLNATDTGFRANAVRLFTMIQAGTEREITQALRAATTTHTRVLLGLRASDNETAFDLELDALKRATREVTELGSLLVGVTVGNDNLYYNSRTAAEANRPVGPAAEAPAQPETLVRYIHRVREALNNTAWTPPNNRQVLVGHADDWTAYGNQSNANLTRILDFVGINVYPFTDTTDGFNHTVDNSVANATVHFRRAIFNTYSPVTAYKQVWITGTGWPTTGPTVNQAVAGIDNARQFWQNTGCGAIFPKFANVFVHTFNDYLPQPNYRSYGVVGPDASKPLYDLGCPAAPSNSTKGS